MKTFKFEDKTVSVPTRWSEVTVEHFIRPEFLSGNSLGLLSALSGVPVIKLANTTQDMDKHFAATVSFLKSNPKGWMGGELPDKFVFMDKECTVPKNIEMRSFGQKLMLGDALSKNTFIYKSIPDAIAIYLGNQLYEDWYERLDEMKAEVLKLPIQQVYPIAAFFLHHTRQLSKGGRIN